MKEDSIDLHTHSVKSDGTLSPRELIAEADKKGLLAIAVTDHDTIAGVDEALAAGREYGIEVIPGVEFSVIYEAELHIVGLFIDHKDDELARIVTALSQTRKTRNQKIVERLRELSIDISPEDLRKYESSIITRAHFARFLIEKGYCKNNSEAFNKYLGFGAPAYVPREKLSAQECIKIIHRAGGIAVLAHLNQIKLDDDLNLIKILSDLKDMGLDGIECYYPEYDEEFEKDCLGFADIFDFIVSGGSDYHGINKENELGIVNGEKALPVSILKNMKRRIKDAL